MCPSSDWGFDESIDEQNSRAKREREEESDKRAAEEDKKGGWGPFRSFSEWGKPSSSPEPESSGGFNTHAPGNNPPREEDPF